MQFFHLFHGGLKLINKCLRQVAVVLVIVRIVFDSVLGLPRLTLLLNFVQYALGLAGQVCKLLANLDKNIVLALDLLKEQFVIVLRHQDSLQFLNGFLLGILDTEVVLQIVIHQPHLLKQLEDHFREIILLVHDVEGLGELLFEVLPLMPLHLKHVEGDLAHFNCTQFG